jgi:hypothetical protein
VEISKKKKKKDCKKWIRMESGSRWRRIRNGRR